MEKRDFGEMVSFFNRRVSEMDISRKYKMELLGMVTAIKIGHDQLMPKWIPFRKRDLTAEEKECNPEWDYMLDCKTPCDYEEILVSDGKYVWFDTFYSGNDGCNLDSDRDLDGLAWMPLPEPWKGKQ